MRGREGGSIFCRQMTTFTAAKGPLFGHFAANVVLLLHLETGHLAAKLGIMLQYVYIAFK